ncbi:hypothetical protein OsJ_34198 [Oryza sativa Japonica Group]|uniref:Retrotransposon gag domain-containing protein n=1 Tax=Oryza sativa subsp. japonica TaxID=39947 RepID=B9GB47_ORYSJ|nr:hypothetical protein OsJ_34198 [Oryza sativa Japonica Group]
MLATATARSVWCDLAHQFLGNQECCTINVNAEFRNFSQGELSVTDYCRCLKSMADTLSDLGKPVSDGALKPFPSFMDARSQLPLEDIMKGSQPAETASVFVADTVSGASRPASSNNGSGGVPQNSTNGSVSGKNNSRNHGCGHSNSDGSGGNNGGG